MKHLLKICGLVIVLTCMLVSNAFACKVLLSPAIWADAHAYCLIRNSDDRRQLDVTIEICRNNFCDTPVTYSINPGEAAAQSFLDGTGFYYCNFEVSKRKKVSVSICSDLGCMAIPRK